MKDLRCKIGIHDWKRVGITKPLRYVSEFVARRYIGHYAMGECPRCGKQDLREVDSSYREWYHSDEVTKREYAIQFSLGEYKLD